MPMIRMFDVHYLNRLSNSCGKENSGVLKYIPLQFAIGGVVQTDQLFRPNSSAAKMPVFISISQF